MPPPISERIYYRRQVIAKGLFLGSRLFVGQGETIRAQTPEVIHFPLTPIVSREIFRGVPVQFPFTPAEHCTQAGIYSGVNTLYRSNVATYGDIDNLTQYKPGVGTWYCSAVLAQENYIPNVHLKTKIDYAVVQNDTHQPINVQQASSILVNTRPDLYTLDPMFNAESVLHELGNNLVIARMNEAIINDTPDKIFDHSLLLYAYDDDMVSVLDPDFASVYRKIKRDTFYKAFLGEMITIPRNFLSLPTN